MTDLATPPDTATATATATAICVFAVCPRGNAPDLVGVAGHAEAAAAPVRPLHAGPLTAVVQPVPAYDFAPEALRERLSDPAALEAHARAHDRVVAAVAAAAPTVPLPLATLYLSEERARQAILKEGAVSWPCSTG